MQAPHAPQGNLSSKPVLCLINGLVILHQPCTSSRMRSWNRWFGALGLVLWNPIPKKSYSFVTNSEQGHPSSYFWTTQKTVPIPDIFGDRLTWPGDNKSRVSGWHQEMNSRVGDDLRSCSARCWWLSIHHTNQLAVKDCKQQFWRLNSGILPSSSIYFNNVSVPSSCSLRDLPLILSFHVFQQHQRYLAIVKFQAIWKDGEFKDDT